LLEEEATVVHDRIAERLLRDFPAQASVTEHAQIARHLDGAGRLEEAVQHYHRAAEGAFEQFGAAEALRLCDRVLERTSPDTDTGFEALRLREQALREIGAKVEHRDALELLAEQVEHRGDPRERAEIYLRLARYHYDQAEFKTSMEYIERVRELAAPHNLSAAHAQSLHYEAYINLDQGHREDALELIRQAIQLYEETTDEDAARRGLSSCYNTRGIIMRRAGRHQDALSSYQRALDLLDGNKNERLGRYLLINMGLALVYVGRFDDGLECYQRALAQAKQLGHRRDEAGVLINMGHAYQVLGDYDRAISHIQRGLYLARKASANYTLADGEITLGVCYAELGELDKAERVLSEGLRLAESIPHIYLAVHAMLALAKLKLETAQVQDARVAILQAEDSLERCEAAGMRWGVLSAQLVLARAFQILGKQERQTRAVLAAKQLVEEGEEYAREEAYYYISQLLPDDEEFRERRQEAIEQARSLVIRNADGIQDEPLRQSFLARGLHQKILSASQDMS
jgi:tetratricopeptide (TPR) repeat protein